MSSSQETERLWIALLFAGGKGSRMAAEGPKPLVEVGGTSLLEAGISRVLAAGADQVHIAVHHDAERIVSAIEERLGDEPRLSWVRESSPLGTIGSLQKLQPTGHPVLTANGDLLSGIDLEAMWRAHNQSGAAGTLAVHLEHHRLQLGEVQSDQQGRVLSYAEKPVKSYPIASGTNIFEPEVVRLIENEESLGAPDLVQRALESGLFLNTFRHDAPWLDVNTPEELGQARALFSRHRDVLSPPPRHPRGQ